MTCLNSPNPVIFGVRLQFGTSNNDFSGGRAGAGRSPKRAFLFYTLQPGWSRSPSRDAPDGCVRMFSIVGSPATSKEGQNESQQQATDHTACVSSAAGQPLPKPNNFRSRAASKTIVLKQLCVVVRNIDDLKLCSAHSTVYYPGVDS
jgi:hypothetical protein